jgi:hypothetical protein
MRTDSARGRWRPPWRNVLAGTVALLALAVLALSPLIGLKIVEAVRAHRAAVANAHANHIGDSVHDADVEFVVRSSVCGLTTLAGADGRPLTPVNGTFCVVSVGVRNVGPSTVGLPDPVQLATGSRGAVYLPDRGADTRVNAGDPTLAPGSSVRAAFVYDVPAGIRLREISLHGAEYSRGVVVAL